MDLDFLPKSVKGPTQAILTGVAIAAAAVAGYLTLESTLITKATAAGRDAVSELKSDVKEIKADGKFTRCALVVHMKAGTAAELVKCSE